MGSYDSAADPVHGAGWNSAARWGGWDWREPTRGEHFRRCSFCGSISPEDLAAESAWRADWADRKYGWPHKFYVDIVNRNAGALFVISGRSDATQGPYAPGGEKWTPPEPGLIAWEDLTPEQLAIAERDGWQRTDYVRFGTRASHFGKFYTVHLADLRVSQDVKDTIQRTGGLRFTWLDDGRVSWQAWQDPEPA